MLSKAKIKSKSKGDYNSSFLHIHNDNTIKKTRKVLANGIPVLSIFALVGILSMMISLDSSGVVGLKLGIGNSILGLSDSSNKAYAESMDNTNNTSVSSIANMSNGSDVGTDATNSIEEGIAPYATTASASLSIGGAGETEQVAAGRGTVTYRTHTVRVQASEINNYSLTISGPSNLVSPTGSGSESTITGISNKTGSEMGTSSTYDNTWGYGWGDTSTSEDNLVYRTLSTTGTNILTVNGSNDKPALSNRAVDFTRKLVFAVKFGENAMAGRYYANVTLSLTASPAILTTYSITYNGNGNTGGTVPTKQEASVYDTTSYSFTVPSTTLTKTGYNFIGWSTSSTATSATYKVGDTITLTSASPSMTLYAVWEANLNWNNITEMQQMTPVVCAGASIGATKTLTDIRDGSTYTVKKLNSEQCWMTQNLRIINKTISSTDSDMTSGSFTVPASSTSGFSSNTASNAYYPNDTTKGAYYTWCAATAGSCSSATSGGKNASASICPKGWYLPVGGKGTSGTNTGATSDTKNDFMVMAGKTSTSSFADASLVSGTNITLGTTTWPFAGYYNNSAPNDVGTSGFYWSRTASSSTYTYSLDVYNESYVYLDDYSYKYYGHSVRCVAYSN